MSTAIKPPPVVCRNHRDRRDLHHIFRREGMFIVAVAVYGECRKGAANGKKVERKL
jgi:hypothetical protein